MTSYSQPPNNWVEASMPHRVALKFKTVAAMPVRLICCLRSMRRIKSSIAHLQAMHSQGMHKTQRKQQTLPDSLLFHVLDFALPLDLCSWRRVSKSFKGYVDRRISNVTEIEVRKMGIEEGRASTSTLLIPASNRETVGYVRCEWQNFRKARVTIRLLCAANGASGDRIELIVDQSWSSADVTALCQSMAAFRKSVVRATIDAPIAEMLVVSLSVIDLSRWYAYLCMLKAFEGVDLHLSAAKRVCNDDIYWPNLVSLTVRTSQKDSEHLARVLDYGVSSNLVIDRRRIEQLHVQLTDVYEWNDNLLKNLYCFRCWAGSAAFGDRFRQKFPELPHV
uniref:F-box domain-containing protein n=1 Tax=Parascaris univalens TaxID=6257 RepID=A0A915B1J2_PARUN